MRGDEGGLDFLSPLLPDFVRVQFAGEVGLFSLGAGYQWWDGKIEPELAYGFVPQSVSGQNIHTVALKTTWAPWRLKYPEWTLFPGLLGASVNVPIGRNYHLLQQEKFHGYYWPSGLYFWLFTGIKARKLFPPGWGARGVAAVVEVGTVDRYAQALLLNDTIDWGEVLSVGLAAQILL